MHTKSLLREGAYERLATAADADFLRQLFAVSLAPLPGIPAEMAGSLADMQFRGREQTYAAQYPDSRNCILCLGDGQPVGRVLTVHRADELRLIDIAISADAQGHGLATAAVRRLQSEAAIAGLPLRLSVVSSNRALHLYQRLGFQIMETDAISAEMAWTLPGAAVPAISNAVTQAEELPAPSLSTELTTSSGEVLQRTEVVDTILAFLQDIGLAIDLATLPDTTFLPGMDLMSGGLRVDVTRLKYPGDLLHEAGHLAVMPPERRLSQRPESSTDGAEEMGAMAWSYAAALHLGLPPSLVFHKDGYKGQAQQLIHDYTTGALRPGVPLLAWMGLCERNADGNSSYPRMTQWLRQDAVPA